MTDPFATTPKPRLVIPSRPAGPAPIPRPRPGAFGRRHPLPPTLDTCRHDDAVYLLDTGVGVAFAYVDRLDLLVTHYGPQLRYVDTVAVEWRVHAKRTVRPLRDGHSAEDKRRHDELTALKVAGARLHATAVELFGAPIETTDDDLDAVDALVAELCALHPPRPVEDGSDRGECASVHVAVQLRNRQATGTSDDEVGGRSSADQSGVRVVVLCANDGRARRLASNYGVAHRNMHSVLREMVIADHLTAEDAFELYERMAEVTALPEDDRPTSPDDFR